MSNDNPKHRTRKKLGGREQAVGGREKAVSDEEYSNGDVVGGRYMVLEKLGKGGFSNAYSVFDMRRNSTLALKVEKEGRHALEAEFGILKHLEALGVDGVPAAYEFFSFRNNSAMTMDMKGPNLKAVAVSEGGVLSVATISLLLVQILGILRQVHDAGYVHRDIKPHNIVCDPDNSINGCFKVYLIDFGLTTRYVNKSGEHLPRGEKACQKGTRGYMSISCHRQGQPSRRDDMESLAYTAAKLLLGGLPWSRMRLKMMSHRRIAKIKERIRPEDIFAGMPEAFPRFLRYARSLRYDQEPDYVPWQKVFLEVSQEQQHAPADASEVSNITCEQDAGRGGNASLHNYFS
nr:casein kinase I homolog 2-like [Procambarus clarkii]